MTQNIVQAAGTNNVDKIVDRLSENLARHADNYGVGISASLMEGLQSFFTELVEEEREGASHDDTFDGMTAEVADYLGAALQRLAGDIEDGNF